jgi:hypothetical protein
MKPLYDGFLRHSRSAYPGLAEFLERATAKLDDTADIESLLSVLGTISSSDAILPQGVDEAVLSAWAKDGRTLRSHLLSYVVEQCETFEREAAKELCGPFLTRVRDRNGTILTTNYDRVIEYVAERVGVRISDGFEPGEIVAPWNGKLDDELPLLKLHGSVTWYGTAGDPQAYLRLDRGYPLPGPDFSLARGGTALETLMIVPTLEKDALRQPYSHLLTRFNDLLADAQALVVVGSSLRDEHLVSVLTYRREHLVVIVIGHSAAQSARRLPGMRVATVDADTEALLRAGQPRLFEFIDSINDSDTVDDVAAAAEAMSRDLTQQIAQWSSLDPATQAALEGTKSTDFGERLAALSALRAAAARDEIEAAVIPMVQDPSPEVRSLAASLLSRFKSVAATNALKAVAINDASPGVRLEASLALQAIGTADAVAALGERKSLNPADSFIETALQAM